MEVETAVSSEKKPWSLRAQAATYVPSNQVLFLPVESRSCALQWSYLPISEWHLLGR